MSFQKFIAQDITVDNDFDLIVRDGDFEANSSDERHINAILLSAKGNYRFAPIVGADAYSFLNSVGQTDTFRREIQEQLTADGYRIDEINFEKSTVNIQAKRIR